ncbi:MAG TPA: hypothetical protein VFV28_09600 [Limnobacter sp.]|nr:hypothetical protein [Limnobacter sp.]
MIIIALVLSGLVLGVLLTIMLAGKLMNNPASRIWLSRWLNWSNNRIPDDCTQLVRHGKWIGSLDNREDT